LIRFIAISQNALLVIISPYDTIINLLLLFSDAVFMYANSAAKPTVQNIVEQGCRVSRNPGKVI